MNLSIFICSTKYINKYNLIVSLSTWLYQELSLLKYTSAKLFKSYVKDLEVTESIIHLNTDVNILNKLFESVVQYVDIYQRTKLLIDHGVKLQPNSNLILRFACWQRCTKTAKLLIDHGANDNDAILYSCTHNHTDILTLLLKSSPDISVNADMLLSNAVINKNIEIVKLLLELDAIKYCSNSSYILCNAVYINNIDIVKLLLDYGADIHTRNDEPLKIACYYKNLDLVKLLLSYDAEPDEITFRYATDSKEITDILKSNKSTTYLIYIFDNLRNDSKNFICDKPSVADTFPSCDNIVRSRHNSSKSTS